MGAVEELTAAERRRRIHIVVTDCGGIVPQFESFYIQSILYGARASTDAFRRFSDAVISEDSPPVIVSAVHEALTHAAGLSRFFWPVETNALAVARGARLRAAFQVSDGSSLHDRRLRNALEHFDERLDEFLLRDPVGVVLPDPIIESHEIADESEGHVFRAVDPWEGVFVILGEKYAFFPIVLEVQRIAELGGGFDLVGRLAAGLEGAGRRGL